MISGGIEFNWPQHHRPTTYMPVDTCIEENADGSISVWVSEMEKMFHQKGMAGFTLRPGCAYLEIKGRFYNRTDGTDAFDTLFIGAEKFPQSQYVSVDAGGVM